MSYNPHNLMVPLFPLYNYKSLDEINLRIRDAEYLIKYYVLQDRKDLYEDLKWAKINPNYNFKSIMKDAPVVGELNFTNEEVYNYLMIFMEFMEEFPLILTKDTPKHKY